MTSDEWDTLFSLIRKAISIEGLTSKEKSDEIMQRAELEGCVYELEEFASYVTR